MAVKGGFASMSGVTFLSKDWQVSSDLTPEGVKVRYQNLTEIDDKASRFILIRKIMVVLNIALDFLTKVPFIRGLAVLLTMMIAMMRRSRFFMFMILYLMVLPYINFGDKPLFHYFMDESTIAIISSFINYLLIGLLISMYFLLTPLFRNHAAEHIVFNAYKDDLNDFTPEKLSKYSRYSDSCGSNFVVIAGIMFAVILYIYPDINQWLHLLLSYSVAFEIFRSRILFTPFRLFGWLAQMLLVTRKPKQLNLALAVVAMYTIDNLDQNGELPPKPEFVKEYIKQ